MSSQKIGPSSLASRVRCCTGAVESSDSILPTTGLVGGCGIGLSLLTDGMFEVSPEGCAPDAAQRAVLPRVVRCRAGAVTSAGAWYGPGSAERHVRDAPHRENAAPRPGHGGV